MEFYLLNGEFAAHGDTWGLKVIILSEEIKCVSVGSMCFSNAIEKGGSKSRNL